MKSIRSLLCQTAVMLGLTCGSASAAVTLTFSTVSQVATNWLDASGSATTLMVWGIVIDTDGNGFSPNSYLPGFAFNQGGATRIGQALQSNSGGSDDVLFISNQLMATQPTTVDSSVIGTNKIGAISGIPLTTPGVPTASAGDSFAIIWFNRTAFGGTAQEEEPFGFFTSPSFVLPSDGQSASFAPVFAGADAQKSMDYKVVPEPAASMLAALSCIGIAIRRKR